jgi:hypothetical protein
MADERIVCAALKDVNSPVIVCGARHYDIVMHKALEAMDRVGDNANWDQGFLTNYGRFVDRYEAFEIAKEMDQIIKKSGNPNDIRLYSEDLY